MTAMELIGTVKLSQFVDQSSTMVATKAPMTRTNGATFNFATAQNKNAAARPKPKKDAEPIKVFLPNKHFFRNSGATKPLKPFRFHSMPMSRAIGSPTAMNMAAGMITSRGKPK